MILRFKIGTCTGNYYVVILLDVHKTEILFLKNNKNIGGGGGDHVTDEKGVDNNRGGGHK